MSKQVALYQRRNMLRVLGSSLAVGTLASSGCFGGFALTRKVFNFNSEVKGKWLRWLVFLLFYCFGVYFVTAFLDAIIFNTIEFWTGNKPLSAVETEQEGENKAVVKSKSKDSVVIDLHRGKAKLAQVTLTRFDDAIMLESNDGRRFFVRDMQIPTQAAPDTEIVDAAGAAVAQLEASQWARAQARMDAGESSVLAMQTVLTEQGPALAKR